jgi:hypothetical protein
MKKIFVLLILGFFVPFTAMAGSDQALHSCEVCGMYIAEYKDTSTLLEYEDEKKQATCGVACMLRLVNDAGGPDAFKSIHVHGWVNKELIPADQAAYVIGSKIIPDMIPNIIAFANKEEAEAFKATKGGEQLSFTQALLSISPMGMTMPTRIKSAVLPAKGSLSVGISYMVMEMDEVQLGSDSIEPADFVKIPMQMMGPKKMESSGEMLMTQYAVTDDLALNLGISTLEKKMEMFTNAGNNVTTSKNSGVGDINFSARYNLWKNTYYSKFFSLLAGTTLPTGDFEIEFKDSPGMQLGTGDFSGTAGLLFSNRIQEFWFHYMVSYTANLENSDEYKFGDVTRFGAALHYTPNYDLMLGLEVDGAEYGKNEYLGVKINNTGGFRSYLSGIVSWKFFTALGGNFNLNVSGGIPLYEDMNHYTTGTQEKAQLGGGYIFNTMLSFKRRFPVNSWL